MPLMNLNSSPPTWPGEPLLDEHDLLSQLLCELGAEDARLPAACRTMSRIGRSGYCAAAPVASAQASSETAKRSMRRWRPSRAAMRLLRCISQTLIRSGGGTTGLRPSAQLLTVLAWS